MNMLETFKDNLKAAALAQQAELFAKAEVLDAEARKIRLKEVLSAKIDRMNAEASAIRAEAAKIADRYFALIA